MQLLAAQQHGAKGGAGAPLSADDLAALTGASAASLSAANSASSMGGAAADEALLQQITVPLQQAQLFQQQGQYTRALPLYEKIIALVDNRSSPDDPIDANSPRGETLAMVLYCRARLFVEAGRDEEALAAMRELLVGLKGAKRSEIVAMVSDLYLMMTSVLMVLRRLPDAADALAKARPLVESLYGKSAPEMTRVIGLEAELLDLRGDKLGAVALHKKAVDGFPPQIPIDNPLKVMRVIKYAAALHALGRFAEANAQLKPIIDVYFEKLRDDENPPLFAHYYATRLMDQENFAEAIVWATKALESPVMSDQNAHFGGMRSIVLVFKTTLLTALDELILRGEADDAVQKRAADLRAAMIKEIDSLNAVRTVSRCLATVNASFKYVDPATLAEADVLAAAQPNGTAATVKDKDDDDDVDDKDNDDDDDDDEIAGDAESAAEAAAAAAATVVAAVAETTSDAVVDAASAVATTVGAAAPKAEFFGKMSLILELVPHPVTGVKLAAGNHLVATFQHPMNHADALTTEHTLTDEDIAKNVRDPTQSLPIKSVVTPSTSTLILTTPGYFHESKPGAVEVVVDIFEDATCTRQIGSHHQLLRCAFDTERIKSFERYRQLPKIADLEVAVDRDYGLSELHMS
jgi:tetratricopeptide (TPR) repeat protein